MTNEVSKNLQCVLMRSGNEIWLEDDRIENLKKVLINLKESKFIDLEGRYINTADISGIYPAKDMEERTRRKNGEWQKEGIWYNRGDYVCAGCGGIIPKGMNCGKKGCPYSR